MTRKLLPLIVASAASALSGCGGSGSDPDDSPIEISAFSGLPGVSNGESASPEDDAPGTVPVNADGVTAAGNSEPVPPTLAADGTTLPSEVDERLRSVFDIINGDVIELSVAVARRLIDVEVGPRDGFAFSRSGIDEATGVENTTLLCPAGGTLDTFSSSLMSSDGVYVLRACGIGPLVIDGRIEGRVRGPDREIEGEVAIEPDYEFGSFSIVDSRTARTIATDVTKVLPYTRSTDAAGADVPIRFGYGSIEAYDARTTIRRGSITDQRAERSYTTIGTARTIARDVATPGYPLGGLATRFEVSFGDDETRVAVRTTAPFQRLDAAGRFASGTLTVVAETYAYTLDAANGDPDTFRLDVTANDVTTSYTVPWSGALGFDAFDPESLDLGF